MNANKIIAITLLMGASALLYYKYKEMKEKSDVDNAKAKELAAAAVTTAPVIPSTATPPIIAESTNQSGLMADQVKSEMFTGVPKDLGFMAFMQDM